MTGKCHGYTCCAADSVCSKRQHRCVPPSPFGAQTPPSLGASNSFEDAVRKAERAIDRAADKAAERVRRFADKIDGKGDEAKPEDAKAPSLAPAPANPGVPNFTVCDINVRCPAPRTCCCVSHSFMTGKCHGYTCCAPGSVCSKHQHRCVPPSPFGAQTPPSLGASNSFEDAVRK